MESKTDLPRLMTEPTDPDHAVPETLAPDEILIDVAAQEVPSPSNPAEREIRYDRGSTVYALDGPVGTLRQIVVDEGQAEVEALVVRDMTKGEPILVPPDLIDRSVGTALFLNVTREQFALGASRSPRFNARMFTGADVRVVAKGIPHAFRGDKQRSLISLTRDSVVTGEVLVPSSPAEAAQQRRWAFLSRNRTN